ncbi:hypothetical protein [Paenibacillus graminis]|nr:hypothetical protein [Paenibacillus graminis]MEC0171218.1 hypothetical protein [Paenibacillus graminis]
MDRKLGSLRIPTANDSTIEGNLELGAPDAHTFPAAAANPNMGI